MNDLERLARAVHEAPEGTKWGQFGTVCMWFKSIPDPEFCPANTYLIENILARRNELTGKPKSGLTIGLGLGRRIATGHGGNTEAGRN